MIPGIVSHRSIVTPLQIYILQALFCCSFIAALFWFRIKFLLRARGYPTSFSRRGHLKDLFYLRELAYSEREPARKKRIQFFRAFLIVLLITSLVLVGALAVTAADTFLSQA